MSKWCPKNSKLSGIPSISYEPCKPVPLGTMFKKGVVCISGVLAFQHIVQGPENNKRNSYSIRVIIHYYHAHLWCSVR